jgi:integrase
MREGKAREMGLGPASGNTLADARRKAEDAARSLMNGSDPLVQKAAQRETPSFGKLAEDVISSIEVGFRNAKHRQQWRNTINTYAKHLLDMKVDAIETDDILKVLKPIWSVKPETASRVRGRIEKVLDAARAQKYRHTENPARWRGNLDHLLPRQSKLARQHHAAMDYKNVPAFMHELREREALAARALEFCILTATRTSETLAAQWSEFDLEGWIWTIPAHRMKAGREHRVPLSTNAYKIVAALSNSRTGVYVFPGNKLDRPLSSMAMEMVLRRMVINDATVHGFRSSFRDWAGNETEFPRELAEHALAHVIGDRSEQSYRRKDALERRRALMENWAEYLKSLNSDVDLL